MLGDYKPPQALLADEASETLPAHPAIRPVPRPVDQKGLAAHLVQVDVAPETAIVTSIPVVAHNKNVVLRHGSWAVIVAIRKAGGLRIATPARRMWCVVLFANY